MSNRLGGDAFTRKYIISLLTLTLGHKVKDKHETLPSILYIIWLMHLQSLKLLCPKVQEEMHLQEIFDLTLTQGQGHMKHCPLQHVTYVPATFEVATASG